jgi:hypothetical protein
VSMKDAAPTEDINVNKNVDVIKDETLT